MPVNTQHKEYANNLKIWEQVRDCDSGPKAIKARGTGGTGSNTLRGMAGTTYLPAPNASDASSENKERYLAYLNRAIFANFTAQTKEGVLGLVFRKETTVETPTALKYLIDDANGGGLSVDQMIKDVSGDVLMVGRYGLLVDYPAADKGLTKDQVAKLDLRANILAYPAESIINWKTETIGGVVKLTMVVLQEPTEKQIDKFESKEVMYHRVLLLRDGMYVQNLYDEDGKMVVYATGEKDDEQEDVFTGDIIPTNSDGKTWDVIPFTFVGSVNNDSTVDKAPLYDISEVNIGHYRNSADYEESSFITGQPTLGVMGLSQSWAKEFMKDGVAMGSRGGVLLPVGGDLKLVQAEANTMPMTGMEHKEKQLVMLGARLITDTGGTETVDAAKMRFAGQNSKMGSITINVESAFVQCFTWAGMFMGATEETIITINKELYDASIDPQMIIAQIQLMDRGVIAKVDLQDFIRRGGVIRSDRTNDEIDADVEETNPLDGGVINADS